MAGLVYVCYRDHVLFSNSDSEMMQPFIRECVGWVKKENEDAILVIWDRTAVPVGEGKRDHSESGLAIVKSDVLEIEHLHFQHHRSQHKDHSLLSGSEHNYDMPNTRSKSRNGRKIRLKEQKEIEKNL